jgi:hypothetical protein
MRRIIALDRAPSGSRLCRPRSAPAPPCDNPSMRLTPVQRVICGVAAIGFAFDTYELLMLPLIVRPALMELTTATPGSAEFPAIPLMLARPFLPESPVWRDKRHADKFQTPRPRRPVPVTQPSFHARFAMHARHFQSFVRVG